MWLKAIFGGAVALAFGLAAFLGVKLIDHYGDARYAAGVADGQLKQVPAILAANAQVTQMALQARDQVIAADGVRDTEVGRVLGLFTSFKERNAVYAQTDAGRAECLGADRMRGIAALGTSLFGFDPTSAPNTAGAGQAGSVPAQLDPAAAGRKPQ
jgi:hypothetical protein